MNSLTVSDFRGINAYLINITRKRSFYRLRSESDSLQITYITQPEISETHRIFLTK